MYEERGRDQLRSLEVAKTGVAKSVADIFIPGFVLSSQCNRQMRHLEAQPNNYSKIFDLALVSLLRI